MALISLFKGGKNTPQDSGDSETLLQSSVESEDSMLMTSSLDSRINSTLDESQGAQASGAQPTVTMPLLGTRTVAEHQSILFAILIIALLALAAGVYWLVSSSNRVATQMETLSVAKVHAQRMAKSAMQSFTGNSAAFAELRESSDGLAGTIRVLREGGQSERDSNVSGLDESYAHELESVSQIVDRDSKGAAAILGQQQVLTHLSAALGAIRARADEMQVAADAAGLLQLAVLSQRIARSASELLTVDGISPEATLRLRNDLNAFRDAVQELRGNGSKAADGHVRERLDALLQLHSAAEAQSAEVLNNLQGLVAAREAQMSIVTDSEPLRAELDKLEGNLSQASGFGLIESLLFLISALLALLATVGLAYLPLLDSRQRQAFAEQQRFAAESLQQESKRVNDANQAAILRLMNELQLVAEGDLTQEATVTEDITGAIADSVNYTVEELRSLVSNVQNTASRVVQTTSTVETTSSEMLKASEEQLREINAASQSVLEMAARINEVSAQAQESANVAQQSLKAATSGQNAVQSAIGGMNAIRDQIQETSKRIKRLGESSQEIGEITELIADITEQTNVLALNAAIQAASAGEAGRGFSVVAEEVQRLAERSGDATRQIAALVKAIQTDTQDAVAAMERSTHGVVEGARLSDNAGTALAEIDSVSRRLADLIRKISETALKEASQANNVAGNIRQILVVTEQASNGTRNTANQVRDLARIADELRQSVARFKIA